MTYDMQSINRNLRVILATAVVASLSISIPGDEPARRGSSISFTSGHVVALQNVKYGRQSNAAAYGGLPLSIITVSVDPVATFADKTVVHNLASFLTVRRPEAALVNGKRKMSLSTVTALTLSLDQLGFSIEGVVGADLLDGPEPGLPLDGAASSSTKYQVARDPQVGSLAKTSDAKATIDPSGDRHADLFEDSTAPQSTAGIARTPPIHPKIRDVSEGTKDDPLYDRSYDLNSAKEVPADLVVK